MTTAHKKNSTRAKSRKTRVYAFREFLMDTYGDYLEEEVQQRLSWSSKDYNCCCNGLVLDVAGGKGDLSWLLNNVDDVPSIVFDPVGNVPKCAIPKSVGYLRMHPEEAKRRSVKGLFTYQPLASLIPKLEGKDDFVVPWHLKACLNQEFVETIRGVVAKEKNAMEDWKIYWSRLAREQSNLTQTNNSTQTNTIIVDHQKALQVILNTKLVVGFHPDQATDYCIELAEILGVPWCIVPCCVFPCEFTRRRLKNGDRVREYSQLIQYLREKCPEAKTAFLDFQFTETAKNMVLYTIRPMRKMPFV